MKLIKVIKNSAEISRAQMDDPSEWISQCSGLGVWGLPERWVPAQEGIDPADILESEMREVKPAIPAQLDEQGNEIAPEAPAEMQEFVKLRAEYTVEIIDISTEHALQQALAARKAEYPSAEEFLNAFFDGGDEALKALRQRRLAIKAKYPKE